MEVLAEAAASLPRAATIASMAAAIPTSTKAVCDYEEGNSDDHDIPLSALVRKPASGIANAARKSARGRTLTEMAKQSKLYNNG
jgi:hypothetical protein